MTTETFFQYWALLWLAMLTFGAFISALMHLFGAELGGLVNIMLFALNQASSNASLPFELQNPFFQVGYALPFNQIVTGGRYILFAVHQLDIGRCVGVLIGWTGFIFVASYRLNIRRKHFQEWGLQEDPSSVKVNRTLSPIVRPPQDVQVEGEITHTKVINKSDLVVPFEVTESMKNLDLDYGTLKTV